MNVAWVVARAAGLLAWLLLDASVVLGILRSTRLAGRRATPAALLRAHTLVGGLTVAALALHVAAVVGDNFVHFGFADVTMPLASAWRPGAVAWGIVGAWAVAAVWLTSLVRDRLPTRVWHGVHLTSYGAWVVTTVHLLQAGSDASTPVVHFLALTATAAVALLSVYALSVHGTRRTASPVSAR